MPSTDPPRNASCPCGSGRKFKRCCQRKLAMGREGYTELDRDRLLEKLVRFVAREEFATEREIADELFWGTPPRGVGRAEFNQVTQTDEWHFAFFLWVSFDMQLDDRKTFADFFLERDGHLLRSGERAFLELLRPSSLRLYEILEVRANEGFELRDLWSERQLFVHERTATAYLTSWQIVYGRVIDGPKGVPVFDSLPCAFGPPHKEMLVKALRDEQRAWSKLSRDGNELGLFKAFAIIVRQLWVDFVAFPPLPSFTTTQGEALAFTKAVFDVTDPAHLTKLFRTSAELDEAADGRFVWLEGDSDSQLVLGTFELSDTRLTFEGMSEGRAERARSFVERLAGPIVNYRATRVEDAQQLLSRTRANKPAGRSSAIGKGKSMSKSGLPAEMEAAIVQQFLEKHYREWIDIPLPALGNRTPRHAAQLKTVRPKLIGLLKQFESGAEQDRRDGRPAYDFGWMWKELGIERA